MHKILTPARGASCDAVPKYASRKPCNGHVGPSARQGTWRRNPDEEARGSVSRNLSSFSRPTMVKEAIWRLSKAPTTRPSAHRSHTWAHHEFMETPWRVMSGPIPVGHIQASSILCWPSWASLLTLYLFLSFSLSQPLLWPS